MSAIERDEQPLAAPVPVAAALPGERLAGRAQPRSVLHPGRWRRWVSPLVVLVVWQLTHVFNLVSEIKLPPPTYLVSTAYNLSVHPTAAFGSLQGALLVSSERFLIGFLFGSVAAVVLALTAGLSRVGDAAVDPLLQMIRTLPLFGLVPVFIIWFGIGAAPKIILVGLGAGVPVYLNTYAGVRSIDRRFYELGKVLSLSRWELYRNVVLPGALPTALVGIRQGLGTAWLALVVAEQINADKGLGFMISQAVSFDRNDVIMVALLVYTILGLITDWIVRMIERRALAWRTDLAAR